MRRNKTRRLAFIKPRKNPEALPLQNSPHQVSPSWKLYHRTTDLTLDLFIPCYCDGDLSTLVISGHPPAIELEKAWEVIEDEYEEKMKSDEHGEWQELGRDINLLETKVNTIRTIADLLEFFPVPDLVTELSPELDHWVGFPMPLDISDKDAFAMQLEGARGHAALYWTEAQALRMQLPKQAAVDPRKRVSREDFDKIIVSLSAHFKYKVSKKDTTVSEFTAMVQDMRRALAAARKIQDN